MPTKVTDYGSDFMRADTMSTANNPYKAEINNSSETINIS